jgi:hypothetical protein
MDALSDRLSDATLFFVLLIVFLSYKLRWRDSSMMLLLVPAFAPAIIGKILMQMEEQPPPPVFLILYIVVAVGVLIWGLFDRHWERHNG